MLLIFLLFINFKIGIISVVPLNSETNLSSNCESVINSPLVEHFLIKDKSLIDSVFIFAQKVINDQRIVSIDSSWPANTRIHIRLISNYSKILTICLGKTEFQKIIIDGVQYKHSKEFHGFIMKLLIKIRPETDWESKH